MTGLRKYKFCNIATLAHLLRDPKEMKMLEMMQKKKIMNQP